MAQPFRHTFTSAPSEIQAVNGYLLCLTALMERLKELTEFKPEKRYIDSVELLDAITETNNELLKLHRQTVGQLILTELKNSNKL